MQVGVISCDMGTRALLTLPRSYGILQVKKDSSHWALHSTEAQIVVYSFTM